MLSLDLRTNLFWKLFFHGIPPVLFFALMQFQLGVTTEGLRLLISKLSGHFLDNFFNSLIITYMYIMYLSFALPVSWPPPFHLSSSCGCSPLCDWVSWGFLIQAWAVGYWLKHRQVTSGHTTEENDSPLPRSHPSSSGREPAFMSLSHTHDELSWIIL